MQEEEAAREALAKNLDYNSSKINADRFLLKSFNMKTGNKEGYYQKHATTYLSRRNQMITYLKHVGKQEAMLNEKMMIKEEEKKDESVHRKKTQEEDRSKKRKRDDDLKICLLISSDEDKVIDVESLDSSIILY
ncbi:hypothetical protein Tco_1193784 [Tanacetum coccineum]